MRRLTPDHSFLFSELEQAFDPDPEAAPHLERGADQDTVITIGFLDDLGQARVSVTRTHFDRESLFKHRDEIRAAYVELLKTLGAEVLNIQVSFEREETIHVNRVVPNLRVVR